MVDECQSDWDEKIDTCSVDGVQSISTGLNKAVTVFHALSAGHAADIEILQQAQHLDQQDPNAISARIDHLLQSREEAFKKADANIAIAQKKQKETYDSANLQF